MTQFRKERVGIREEEMGGNDALWKKYGFRCRWLSPICIHSFMVLSRKGTLPCFLCSKEIVFVIFNFCFTALHKVGQTNNCELIYNIFSIKSEK